MAIEDELRERLRKVEALLFGCPRAFVREGDRQETLTEWYAIRSDTRQREKLRCAMTETTSGRWKKSPRAPGDLKWLLDRAEKLASDRNAIGFDSFARLPNHCSARPARTEERRGSERGCDAARLVDWPVYPRWQQICPLHGRSANPFAGRAVVVFTAVESA